MFPHTLGLVAPGPAIGQGTEPVQPIRRTVPAKGGARPPPRLSCGALRVARRASRDVGGNAADRPLEGTAALPGIWVERERPPGHRAVERAERNIGNDRGHRNPFSRSSKGVLKQRMPARKRINPSNTKLQRSVSLRRGSRLNLCGLDLYVGESPLDSLPARRLLFEFVCFVLRPNSRRSQYELRHSYHGTLLAKLSVSAAA